MGLNQSTIREVVADENKTNTSNLIIKVILLAFGLVVLLIIAGIINIYMNEANGYKKYEEATQRCGYTPIVYDRDDGFRVVGGAPNPKLELADSLNSGANNEYYCTLTEAKADGHSQEEIDSVQQEINIRNDIPANVKSEYR